VFFSGSFLLLVLLLALFGGGLVSMVAVIYGRYHDSVLSLLYVPTIALVASFAAVGLWFIAKVEALSLTVLVA
jgi:hypothetical protein